VTDLLHATLVRVKRASSRCRPAGVRLAVGLLVRLGVGARLRWCLLLLLHIELVCALGKSRELLRRTYSHGESVRRRLSGVRERSSGVCRRLPDCAKMARTTRALLGGVVE